MKNISIFTTLTVSSLPIPHNKHLNKSPNCEEQVEARQAKKDDSPQHRHQDLADVAQYCLGWF